MKNFGEADLRQRYAQFREVDGDSFIADSPEI
jgi:hypothetical protein